MTVTKMVCIAQVKLNFFRGKFLEINPVSIDDNENIFEQDIVIQLENGMKISLFDESGLCDKNIIGKIKEFQILSGILLTLEKKAIKIEDRGIFLFALPKCHFHLLS